MPASNLLFRAKVSSPPVRAALVLRPRLYQRLNQGLECRLTLISAPAGYGKTTLLAEWAASLHIPVAWLTLDSEENHPASFCSYFWYALDRAAKFPDWPSLAAIGEMPLQAALMRMLISLEQFDQPLALVLDDYHVISNALIHQALAAFLERLPAHTHLLMATRKDPPLPLARLRARGELIEVRAAHLRFSTEESANFLEKKMGLRLALEDAVTLTEHMEGWAAGLQMAGLSLQEQADPRLFIQSISGNHPFLLDYLVEEVLNTQPEEIQSFLLHTSILRRLNAPLCAAMVESDSTVAAERLNSLERANLFLTPLDPAREWFRYHHLFAEILQRRLIEIEGAKAAAILHMRAAHWYHQAGEPVEGIHHAMAARDWPTAAEMMAFWGTEFFKTGAMGAYLPLLKALPQQELRRHPQLIQDLGWVLALTHDLEKADEYLRLAETVEPVLPDFMGETLAGRAYVACFQFRLDDALALSQRALELLNPEYDFMRGVAAMVAGMAHWFMGKPAASEQFMQAALNAARRSNSPRVNKTALAYLGRAKVLAMDFLGAEELVRNAIGDDPRPQLSPGNEVPAFDLAALYYEWNDLKRSRQTLQWGFGANEMSENLQNRATGCRILARLEMAEARPEEAWKAAQQAVQWTTAIGSAPYFQSLNAACCVEVALAWGNYRLAEEWAERIGESMGMDAFRPLPGLAQARLWIAQGKPELAMRLLSGLAARTASPAWRFAGLRLRLLQALAEPQRAASYLTPEWITSALQQKLVRSFLELGEPLAAMLHTLPPPVEPGLAERLNSLIRTCQGEPFARAVPQFPDPDLPPMVESLSEREREILYLMAAGKNTSQMAEVLYVAQSTVRSHIKNIFAKLDAHNRLQAVEQARRRRLI